MSRLTTLESEATVCAIFATPDLRCRSCKWFDNPYCKVPIGMTDIIEVINYVSIPQN